MELSKLLMPGAVRFIGQLTGKKRLFQELGEIAAQAYGLNASVATDGLQERESLGATGVGHGIALPHARLDDLDRIVAVFLRMEKPLDYDSVDRIWRGSPESLGAGVAHDARSGRLRKAARQHRSGQTARDLDRGAHRASGLRPPSAA